MRMASPVAMGAIKEFKSEEDRINPYLERVALFLLANRVEEDARVPAFLSIIGGKNSLCAARLDIPSPGADPKGFFLPHPFP